MGVEPLPNIRDGILVERLVKTMRYVADMRRRQYVVQRPERVRRRQRLSVEYVNRRAGDLLVLQHADQSLLFDDRPARRIDQPGRWLHSLQLRGPYQAARTAGPWKPRLRPQLWRPRASCSGSRRSDSFQKRSRPARPVIQSAQVPERQE